MRRKPDSPPVALTSNVCGVDDQLSILRRDLQQTESNCPDAAIADKRVLDDSAIDDFIRTQGLPVLMVEDGRRVGQKFRKGDQKRIGLSKLNITTRARVPASAS